MNRNVVEDEHKVAGEVNSTVAATILVVGFGGRKLTTLSTEADQRRA